MIAVAAGTFFTVATPIVFSDTAATGTRSRTAGSDNLLAASPSLAPSPSRTATPTFNESSTLTAWSAEQDVTPIIDLHGNEVIDAVATYSLDPAGSLYEEHSPQTELPQLGVPQS
jgi:hypothetical protein